MICKKCGQEIPDDSKFCPLCGEKVEAAAAPVAPVAPAAPATPVAPAAPAASSPATYTEQPKAYDSAEKKGGIADLFRKIPAKAWGIAVAVILAVFIICRIVSCAAGKSPFITADAKNQILTYRGDTFYTTAGKEIKIDEEVADYDYEYNYNHTICVAMDKEKTLWLVTTKKAVEIAGDVDTYSISFYGDTIVYGDEDGLYVYDVSKKKSKEIYDDDDYRYIVISPDGSRVAFADEKGNYYISKNGKAAEEQGKGLPVAITNDGKHVFYMKNDKLYENDNKLCNYDYDMDIYFNATNTEVLYCTEGYVYYYTTKSKEPVKVKAGNSAYPVCPDNTARVKTFDKSVIRIDGNVYYMYKKGEEVNKLFGSYDDYEISEDGKSIIYTNKGSIYKISNVASKKDAKEIAEDVDAVWLYPSRNLKTIYYTTKDAEICYLKGSKKVTVFDDSYYRIAYDEKQKCLVVIERDAKKGTIEDVLTFKTTKKSKQTLKISEDASYLTVYNGSVYIVASDKSDKYYYKLVSNKKVKQIIAVED